MERVSRSLRKLPVREEKSAVNRSKSRGRAPATPPRARKNKSPGRRSRSRSSARKKTEPIVSVPLINEPVDNKEVINKKSRAKSPIITKVASRMKNTIENIRLSLSPETEHFVRRSMSRFDDLRIEVATTRSSLRKRNEALNSVSPIKMNTTETIEDLLLEEDQENNKSVVGNHKVEENYTSGVNWFKLIRVGFLLLLGLLLSSIAIAAHLLCTRDDCRLVLSNLWKGVNYELYFDPYTWLGYSMSLALLFAVSRYPFSQQKRIQHFSLIGFLSAVVTLGSLFACNHFFFGSLRKLSFLSLASGSLAHFLAFIAVVGKSHHLVGVQVEALVNRVSAIILIVLNGCLGAAEMSRAIPNPSVYLICGLQLSSGLDSLLAPGPCIEGGPLSLLWISLKPFIFVLPQIYLSANNIKLETGSIAAVVILHLLGYVLYRVSSTMKTRFHRAAASARYSSTYVYILSILLLPIQLILGYSRSSGNVGEPLVGPWAHVRHPHLAGIYLMELAWVLATCPSPLCYVLPFFSTAAAFCSARTADEHLPYSYRTQVQSSLIPYIY